MTLGDKIGHYVRYCRGVHELLQRPVPEDWRGQIEEQRQNRESRWLGTVKKAIFARPENPYHQMFKAAGCSHGDLEQEVSGKGLEPTLRKLLENGVYLTHDEFKGKTPIVRSGLELNASNDDFGNPMARGGYEGRSSGSRSEGTRTRKTAEFRLYSTGYGRLRAQEFDLDSRVACSIRPILPAGTGIGTSLRSARSGDRLEKWFAAGGSMADSFHYRSLTNFLIGYARLRGFPAKFPTHLPSNDFLAPAQWLAARKKEGRSCVVQAFVSPGVRVAATALDRGLDISGSLFMLGGEALTPGKRQTVESAGCEVSVGYHISEVGPVGAACRQMGGNCVHLFDDAVEAITRQREAPISGAPVSSLMFTSLLPSAPYLFINAEMDDAGVVEQAPCDCAYSRMGFRRQIRDIFSYGKLTGHGVTLVGADVIEILENVLPARFGGAPTDYQLVETEGQGQTQLILRVSPRVKFDSLSAIRELFMSELSQRYGGALAARVWSHSEGFEVVQKEPFATRTGKVLSLHLIGSPGLDAPQPSRKAGTSQS